MNNTTLADMLHGVLIHNFSSILDTSSGLLLGLAMIELLFFFYRFCHTTREARKVRGEYE